MLTNEVDHLSPGRGSGHAGHHKRLLVMDPLAKTQWWVHRELVRTVPKLIFCLGPSTQPLNRQLLEWGLPQKQS